MAKLISEFLEIHKAKIFGSVSVSSSFEIKEYGS